jgi:hypothetical protein
MKTRPLALAVALLALGQGACGRYGPPVRQAPQSAPVEVAEAAESDATAQDERDRSKQKP